MASQPHQQTRLNIVHQLTLIQISCDASDVAQATTGATRTLARRILRYATAVLQESDTLLATIPDDATRDRIAALTPAQIVEALTAYVQSHSQPRCTPGTYSMKDE